MNGAEHDTNSLNGIFGGQDAVAGAQDEHVDPTLASGDRSLQKDQANNSMGPVAPNSSSRSLTNQRASPTIQFPTEALNDYGQTRPASSSSNGYLYLGSDSQSLRPESPKLAHQRRSSSSTRQRLAAGIGKIQTVRRLSQGRLDAPKACQRCARLKLTFESFVIENDVQNVGGRRPNFYGKRHMGSYQDIRARAENCELCCLLVKSMDQRPTDTLAGIRDDPTAHCYLFWRVDGREHIHKRDTAGENTPTNGRLRSNNQRSHTVKRTRRLAIEWKSTQAKYDIAYVVLVAPDGSFFPDGTVNPQGDRTARATFFLGRKLTSLGKGNTELVKQWLSLCKDHHVECAIDYSDPRFHGLVNSPSFSVVNVERMCLGELPEGERYIALSYTWGPQQQKDTPDAAGATEHSNANVDDIGGNESDDSLPYELAKSTDPPKDKSRFVTTDRNIEELEKDFGIAKVLKDMPLAIQNAIALTRFLGYKYIWIDSLCIVQYNSISWEVNARLMDVVYGHADLTICAADGNGADVGLEGIYSPTSMAEQSYRPATDQQVTVRYPTRCSDFETLELMLSWPSETYVACSRWNRRAWTFQERMVSRRCLVCVNKRVYFQCRSTTMSEDIYSDVETARGSAGWSVELYGAPAHTLNRIAHDPIGVYKDCLRMYTSRELSFEQDVLSAFAGIGNFISQYLGRAIDDHEKDRALLFGLPASHFDFALLWQPQEAAQRRYLSDSKDTIFPSWSWSGWKCKQGISYRRAAVAGPEINLHEWLLRHTWIVYYIRDSNGSLRLVWDPKRFTSGLQHTEGRWKSYDTPQGGWPKPSSVDVRFDFYGRPFDHSLPIRGRFYENGRWTNGQFEEKLHPFRRKNRLLAPGAASTEVSKPDRPYLQFWTWWGRFYVDVEAEEDRFSETAASVGRGLKRYAILDRHRDFAGTVVLDETWCNGPLAAEAQEFIALSEARNFDETEYGDWNLYTEDDLEVVPWQLYNVLMIVRSDPNKGDNHDNVAYRCGLGKIYKDAFQHACIDQQSGTADHPLWKEIILG